jgi:hypothetical protein
MVEARRRGDIGPIPQFAGAVVLLPRVDQDATPERCAPGPVLDILVALDDEPRPGLLNRKRGVEALEARD